jgi:hypothetical protein
VHTRRTGSHGPHTVQSSVLCERGVGWPAGEGERSAELHRLDRSVLIRCSRCALEVWSSPARDRSRADSSRPGHGPGVFTWTVPHFAVPRPHHWGGNYYTRLAFHPKNRSCLLRAGPPDVDERGRWSFEVRRTEPRTPNVEPATPGIPVEKLAGSGGAGHLVFMWFSRSRASPSARRERGQRGDRNAKLGERETNPEPNLMTYMTSRHSINNI